MENVSNPIIIDQYYCDSLFPCPNQVMIEFQHVILKDITTEKRGCRASLISEKTDDSSVLLCCYVRFSVDPTNSSLLVVFGGWKSKGFLYAKSFYGDCVWEFQFET